MSSKEDASELFENESQATSFVRWFKRRNLPGKFTYIGATVSSHLAYETTGHNHDVTRHVDLEATSVHAAWGSELQLIDTMVDLGPGDGGHSIALLTTMKERYGWSPRRYVAVDFSQTLGRHALTLIAHRWPHLEAKFVQLDLEEHCGDLSHLRFGATALYTLLGNTVGNVESVDRTLHIVASCAQGGGRLIVGYALYNPSQLAASYERPYVDEVYSSNIVDPLVLTGIPRSIIDVRTAYDALSRTIVSTAEIRNHGEVSIAGERLTVEPGETFRCFISRRFEEFEMMSALKRARLRVFDSRLRDSVGVASCSPLETSNEDEG